MDGPTKSASELTTRELVALAAAVFVLPWAIVVLPLTLQDPQRIVLALGPMVLLAIAASPDEPGLQLLIAIGGSALSIGALAFAGRRAPIVLLAAAIGIFAAACWGATQAS